jgi:hypothetical protein
MGNMTAINRYSVFQQEYFTLLDRLLSESTNGYRDAVIEMASVWNKSDTPFDIRLAVLQKTRERWEKRRRFWAMVSCGS